MFGASAQDITALRQAYPEAPDTLVELLQIVDDTCFREYGNQEISLFCLGSNVGTYPYYLLSAKQICENREMAKRYYADYIDREYPPEDVAMDDRVTTDSEALCWLHFSDCMNNGGTSQLFLDFSPSATGTKRQVVRYLHDPDSFAVIAESFDKYLEKLMNDNYPFVNEETVECL